MTEEVQSPKPPSYRRAREELAGSAGRLRLYGVELDNPDDRTAIAIWFCGYRADATDIRTGSRRIFRIAKEDIVQSGRVDGFTYEEHQVRWFDVVSQARLLEECFVAIEASDLAGPPAEDRKLTALQRIRGGVGFHFPPQFEAPILTPWIPIEPIPTPVVVNPPSPNPVPILTPLNPD